VICGRRGANTTGGARGGLGRRPSRTRGAALVIALLVMAALLLLGTTFLTISTTETDIARNAGEAAQAFYVASTGLTRFERDLLAQFAMPYQASCPGNLFSGIADLRQLTRISGEPLGVPGQRVDGDGSVTCAKPGTPYYLLPTSPVAATWVTVPYAGAAPGGTYQVEVRNATPPNAAPPQVPNTIEVRVTATTRTSTGASRQLQALLQVQRFSPADQALFVDGGVWRWSGMANMAFAGPVFAKGWSATYPAMQLGDGGASDQILNYFKNMDATLQAAIPPVPMMPDPATGQQVASLDATLRVYLGPVGIGNASSSVGENTAPGSNPKGTLSGVYTNQGFTGTPGASQVYSDNGSVGGFDVPRELTTFPELTSPYSGAPLGGGGTPLSHDAYLKANALGVDGGLTIDNTTQSFSYPAGLTDPSQCPANCLFYQPGDPAGPTLVVNGIVWVKGDIGLGGYGSNRLPTLRYKGTGTLYARTDTPDLGSGSIEVTSDVLPSPLRSDGTTGAQFPTDHRLGLIASGWISVGDWATFGTSAPPLRIAASMYTNTGMLNYAPYQIAGSVLTRYFYVWQTAGIYYVPALAGARPPGMPGVSPGKSNSPYFIRTLSWRDVMP